VAFDTNCRREPGYCQNIRYTQQFCTDDGWVEACANTTVITLPPQVNNILNDIEINNTPKEFTSELNPVNTAKPPSVVSMIFIIIGSILLIVLATLITFFIAHKRYESNNIQVSV
jgi:hypothetical protein